VLKFKRNFRRQRVNVLCKNTIRGTFVWNTVYQSGSAPGKKGSPLNNAEAPLFVAPLTRSSKRAARSSSVVLVGCGCYVFELNRSINSKWAIFEFQYCIQWAVCTAVCTDWYTRTVHLFSDASDRLGRFTLCLTFPFRQGSIFVPSELSVFTLSVVFRHLPEQHVIGQRLFPSDMQPPATECVFRYLLIIRTSVMIEW
jgi:hypothetical protein